MKHKCIPQDHSTTCMPATIDDSGCPVSSDGDTSFGVLSMSEIESESENAGATVSVVL